jgi:4-hydroxy-tetrahydrodipicolinate synthase
MFTQIADESTVPVILYNVPSRTGMNITPETYKKLSEHRNIVAVKEADPNINKLMKSIALCQNKLDFYIGNDDLITVSAYIGCKGVISVLSNILPGFTRDMTMAAINGKIGKANKMQIDSLELIEAIFCDVNPIPIKEAMKILGYDTGYLRGPLTELSTEKQNKLEVIIYKYHSLLIDENRADLL